MEEALREARSRGLGALSAAAAAAGAAWAAGALGGGFLATTALLGGALLGVPAFFALRDPGRDPLGLAGRPRLLVALALAALSLPAFVAARRLLGRPAPGPPDPLELGATLALQLFAVALPEEILFRGFVQRRLAAWRRREGGGGRRLRGAEVGLELPAAAALFALYHLPAQGPRGLLAFFPGLLFGWAFARTGNVWAAAAFHAACNVVAVLA